jgi:uncharacterized UBP type Zn finger protein
VSDCTHLDDVPADPKPQGGCTACLAVGDKWVHLRFCIECGNIGCCDQSKNRHARSHAAESGHPVARSKEPGEMWAWCYEDETGVPIEAEEAWA